MSEEGKEKVKEHKKQYRQNISEDNKQKKKRIHEKIPKITLKKSIE